MQEASNQWGWPSGTTFIYLSISSTLFHFSLGWNYIFFLSPLARDSLIFSLILSLLLFMIYPLQLSYLMLQNGWEDGFCGWWYRKQRSPVIYPSQWSWLNTSQHRGRWKSHPAPWTLCCPIQSGAQCEMATVPWNSCQGDAYRDFWLKETAFGVSVGVELRVSPYGKRTKCPFLEKHLGMFHMPSYSLHPGWRMLSRAHGSYSHTIPGNPGICRS